MRFLRPVSSPDALLPPPHYPPPARPVQVLKVEDGALQQLVHVDEGVGLGGQKIRGALSAQCDALFWDQAYGVGGGRHAPHPCRLPAKLAVRLAGPAGGQAGGCWEIRQVFSPRTWPHHLRPVVALKQAGTSQGRAALGPPQSCSGKKEKGAKRNERALHQGFQEPRGRGAIFLLHMHTCTWQGMPLDQNGCSFCQLKFQPAVPAPCLVMLR